MCFNRMAQSTQTLKMPASHNGKNSGGQMHTVDLSAPSTQNDSGIISREPQLEFIPPADDDDDAPKVNIRKTNVPKVTKLRQQKLSSWEPTLTASTVIPTIFIVAVVFIPVGIALLLASNSVKEFSIPYESCEEGAPCQINFELTEDMNGDVFFYYGLRNFFQNHRRYMKSRNDKQLLGNLDSVSECDPYDKVNTSSGTPKNIAPCGAIANSMFNDTFELFDSNNQRVSWTYNGVVWDVDKKKKFKNPEIPPGGDLCKAFENTVKPMNWAKRPCELDIVDPNNNGFENVDFIVWMRTAALPHFRKPFRILLRDTGRYQDGLPKGAYTLLVNNNFPVRHFNGRKWFIISTTSWAGGKNSFLGVAYLVVGGICAILAVAFVIIHLKFGQSMKEMADLSRLRPE